MSVASNKVLDACAKYVETMRAIGKTPSAIYVTRKQYEEVVKAENVGKWDDYKGFPIRIHG